MIERITLDQFAPRADGPTLNLSIGVGQSLAIAGPAASGKTSLLRVLAGEQKPVRGTSRILGDVTLAGAEPLPRRSKVQTLVRPTNKVPATDISNLLTATGLWDARHSSVSELSPAQVSALEVVIALVSGHEVVLIDGQLDRIDPWALPGVTAWMRARTGATFVMTTNRPDLLAEVDVIVVLKANQIRFAGSPADLIRQGPRSELVISTRNQEGVKALVEPFEVSIRQNAGLVHLETSEGQDLSARLLVEGYGDVKFIVVREPTLAEALTAL